MKINWNLWRFHEMNMKIYVIPFIIHELLWKSMKLNGYLWNSIEIYENQRNCWIVVSVVSFVVLWYNSPYICIIFNTTCIIYRIISYVFNTHTVPSGIRNDTNIWWIVSMCKKMIQLTQQLNNSLISIDFHTFCMISACF